MSVKSQNVLACVTSMTMLKNDKYTLFFLNYKRMLSAASLLFQSAPVPIIVCWNIKSVMRKTPTLLAS